MQPLMVRCLRIGRTHRIRPEVQRGRLMRTCGGAQATRTCFKRAFACSCVTLRVVRRPLWPQVSDVCARGCRPSQQTRQRELVRGRRRGGHATSARPAGRPLEPVGDGILRTHGRQGIAQMAHGTRQVDGEYLLLPPTLLTSIFLRRFNPGTRSEQPRENWSRFRPVA